MEDKRKYTRVSVDAYITATLTTEKAFQERMFISSDISPEGIFLATNEPLPLRSILNLKIYTPTMSEPIKAEAKVIRLAKDENSRVVGVGVILTKISDKDRKELYKHLYLAYHYVQKA